MINVSRPYLPPLREYNKYLKKIWKSHWLTNGGELVKKLEEKLKEYWGAKNVVCVNNGTSALMLAIKALDIKKEVYVSPFGFVTTAGVPVWMGIKPKFVDLDEEYGSPAIITHNYGIPSQRFADTVIYDASHAFTTKIGDYSIVNEGDISIVSFHAVKIFHTIEGGAIVTKSDKLADKIRWMRNHGYKTNYSFNGAGINCKMNEFQAAMGLCNLKTIDKVRQRYTEIINKYDEALCDDEEELASDYFTYYPFFFENERKLLKAISLLEKENIYPRRYFYPPLNTVFGGKKCPLAENLSKKVLCLPLYYELKDKEIDKIIKIVQAAL